MVKTHQRWSKLNAPQPNTRRRNRQVPAGLPPDGTFQARRGHAADSLVHSEDDGQTGGEVRLPCPSE